ncbi:MAG TPA: bifunctional riboflavin kinase/FAD synthetase [Vulgatibacter sp.]|nr:bifunctional riboflavin kinase/FAD synthetase [Vulgatibacter sp.]
MKVFRSIDEARGALSGCAVAIGNFDGVHLGHRQLLAEAKALAAARGAPAVVLTFEPHPARVLSPEFAPPLIATMARKLRLLEDEGLDAVVIQPFDRAYAATSAEAFVRRDLVEALGARDIVVGFDFTFGRGRAGTPEALARLAGEDAEVHVVPAYARDRLVVSSSKIRELVLAGRVAQAGELLGRPFIVDGRVVPGRGRGRTIGIPTANVDPATELLPAAGVYAVQAVVQGLEGLFAGGANIGRKPTFGEGELTVEVHLLGLEADLYGRDMAVAFLERLRGERRFPSVEELVGQIRLDLEQVREVARRAPPTPLRLAADSLTGPGTRQ